MKRTVFPRVFVFLALVALGLPACRRATSAAASIIRKIAGENEAPTEIKGPPLPSIEMVRDKPYQEIEAYRLSTRQLYNSSRFDELEALAEKARKTKARFGNGSWEIYQFYGCLECRDDEPESMWQLHDAIHKRWIEAKPDSITARVAHADFFISYAWHARGSDFADSVTRDGWRLFGDRLAEAQKVLSAAKKLDSKCPMWWRVEMTVAVGQGWNRAKFDELFAEARKIEPEFWNYDLARANYLLPRWHGKPGDWEEAAEKEIDRPGLGVEGYARVVMWQHGYYENVFRETKVSWPKTRDGMDALRRKYPESQEILNLYALFACQAGDRALAQKLFGEIGGRIWPSTWFDKNEFIRYRNWAYGDEPGVLPK